MQQDPNVLCGRSAYADSRAVCDSGAGLDSDPVSARAVVEAVKVSGCPDFHVTGCGTSAVRAVPPSNVGLDFDSVPDRSAVRLCAPRPFRPPRLTCVTATR